MIGPMAWWRARSGGSSGQVALVRAALARCGLLDDRAAAGLLTGWQQRALPVLATLVRTMPGVRGFAHHLVARTAFFDESVAAALADGIGQVVVLGAGLDTRAWRLGRDGVSFLLVDLPAAVATAPGPPPPRSVRVPHDLSTAGLPDALCRAGWQPGRASIVIAEGLLPYLDADAIDRLLAELGQCCTSGSRLALTAAASHPSRRRRRMQRVAGRLRGEPFRSNLTADALTAMALRHDWLPASQAGSPGRTGRVAVGRVVGLLLVRPAVGTRADRQPPAVQ